MYDLCSKRTCVKTRLLFSEVWLVKCADSSLHQMDHTEGSGPPAKMAAPRLVSASRLMQRRLFIKSMAETAALTCAH